VLEARRFMVKERARFFKSRRTFDVYDGDTSEQVGIAEEVVGALSRAARWFVSRRLVPTTIEVREKPDDSLVFTLTRGRYVLHPRVEVHDSQGALVGSLTSKLVSWSGGFAVADSQNRPFAEVSGDLFGFNYRVTTPGREVELGRVSKTWAGVVKGLFTAADTYLVEVNEDLDEQPLSKMLVLGAALATDMIFRTESRARDG
jgi:uncharacterized protein YxjI